MSFQVAERHVRNVVGFNSSLARSVQQRITREEADNARSDNHCGRQEFPDQSSRSNNPRSRSRSPSESHPESELSGRHHKKRFREELYLFRSRSRSRSPNATRRSSKTTHRSSARTASRASLGSVAPRREELSQQHLAACAGDKTVRSEDRQEAAFSHRQTDAAGAREAKSSDNYSRYARRR